MHATTTAGRSWLRSRLLVAERAWLMPACALLVLAGLFGMHGLSEHGTAAAGDPVMGIGAPAPVATSHHREHVVTASPDGSAMVALHPMSHRDGMGHMGALCLAMLTGLLLGFAGWLSTQRRRPLFGRRFRLVTLPTPRGRDPDPPSLARLSVLRC